MTAAMADMADVLHTHTRRSGIRDMAIRCECGWSESILGMRSSKKAFAAHQAAVLSAAGFGPVRTDEQRLMLAAAWDEGAQAEADAVGLTDEAEAAGEHEATFVCPSLNPYRSQP